MAGQVAIKTPAPYTLEGEQCSPEAFLIFLTEYFYEIQWSALTNGWLIRDSYLKELKDFNIYKNK